MKKIIFIAAILFISCAKDDCPERLAKINMDYAKMIKNPHLTEKQVEDLTNEYQEQIKTACR